MPYNAKRYTSAEISSLSPGGQLVVWDHTVSEEVARAIVDFFGDSNPIHQNKEEAKRFDFSGTVVPASAIFGFFTGLLGSILPEGSVARDISLKFRRPIFAGQAFRIRVDFVSLEEGRLFSCKVAIYDHTSDRGMVFVHGDFSVALPRA